MASLLDDPAIVLARLSLDRYHQMIEVGVLDEDDPYELFEGVLVEKMPEGPEHAYCITMINRLLGRALGDLSWFVRVQNPITTDDSEPEPDLAIVADAVPPSRHPNSDEIAVIIEIAKTSLLRDRTTKQRIYARAGVARYLIVNLVDHVVEVYTEPVAGDEPHYGRHETLVEGMIDLGPISIDASALLPD